jgi:hypothetical protein
MANESASIDQPGGRAVGRSVAERGSLARSGGRVPLKTTDDVAAELARLYRSAKRGDIASVDASRLAFILQGLARVLETVELARRLDTLEAEHAKHRVTHRGS